MKPSAFRIERLLAKVEGEVVPPPRRYVFHFDEVAEAEAQGLPYVLLPRTLSREEWEKKYALPAQASVKRIAFHRQLAERMAPSKSKPRHAGLRSLSAHSSSPITLDDSET